MIQPLANIFTKYRSSKQVQKIICKNEQPDELSMSRNSKFHLTQMSVKKQNQSQQQVRKGPMSLRKLKEKEYSQQKKKS